MNFATNLKLRGLRIFYLIGRNKSGFEIQKRRQKQTAEEKRRKSRPELRQARSTPSGRHCASKMSSSGGGGSEASDQKPSDPPAVKRAKLSLTNQACFLFTLFSSKVVLFLAVKQGWLVYRLFFERLSGIQQNC